MPNKSSETANDLSVPWNDAVRFVRQLSHDLRNDLNALELQSAYISELVHDEESQREVKRLREILSGFNSTLQQLSKKVGDVTPDLIAYPAADFLADLRAEIDRAFPEQRHQITWDVEVDGILKIDPQLLSEMFAELFANAFCHGHDSGPLRARARIENGRLLFTLIEPKAEFNSVTENWGREPLRNVSQRHYGLGLNRAHRIVEGHGGELRARYDPQAAALLSTVTLPVCSQHSGAS
jgi:K+-sensing histidine kinase KdpD